MAKSSLFGQGSDRTGDYFTDVNPNTGTPNKSTMPADRFAQTELFRNKYAGGISADQGGGQYYLNFLRKAQMGPDGRLFIPKGAMANNAMQLYFGSRGPKGEDFLAGDQFASLQSDYAGWLKQTQASDQDYSAYVNYMKANPGRAGTIFGANGPAPAPSTVLGTTRSTVFG